MRSRIEAKGTVVRDPELRTTGSGKAFARVTIAANEVKKDDVEVDATANKWQTAVFWGEEAEKIVDRIRRGMEVLIAGDHVVRDYEDEGGVTRTTSEVHGPRLEVLAEPKGPPTRCRIIATGTVVRDPELRKTGSGKAFTRVSIAADEVVEDGLEVDPKENKWQTAVFWEEAARVESHRIRKGMRVQVRGELVKREYEDESGTNRNLNEIRRAKIEVLGGEKGARRGGEEAA